MEDRRHLSVVPDSVLRFLASPYHR